MWVDGVVTSVAAQTHPVVAAGIVSVPVEPHVAPPIRISKAAVPLLAEIEVLDAVLQKPDAMVGAVEDQPSVTGPREAKVPPVVPSVILTAPRAQSCRSLVAYATAFVFGVPPRTAL